jgi:hypothetical protein
MAAQTKRPSAIAVTVKKETTKDKSPTPRIA